MANVTIQQPNVLVNRADVVNMLDAVRDACEPSGLTRDALDALRILLLSKALRTYGDVPGEGN